MFTPNRDEVRSFFREAWKKQRERAVLEGLEALAADIVAAHPEYQALLEGPVEELSREFTPEGGEVNPFLHLSLHLAIAEQLSIDQPPGIAAAYRNLTATREPHEALHVLLDCLGEAVWRASREGRLDHEAYLECIRCKGS
ncbi:MAG TPA: DUF1841 family protein [Rhodocyclaceae bacterium]